MFVVQESVTKIWAWIRTVERILFAGLSHVESIHVTADDLHQLRVTAFRRFASRLSNAFPHFREFAVNNVWHNEFCMHLAKFNNFILRCFPHTLYLRVFAVACERKAFDLWSAAMSSSVCVCVVVKLIGGTYKELWWSKYSLTKFPGDCTAFVAAMVWTVCRSFYAWASVFA